MRERILYYAVKYQGDWKKIARAIAQKEAWQIIDYPCKYTTIVDDDYPQKLKRLQYAPWILFYEGNLSLCEGKICAVIGSRKVSEQSKQICHQITSVLSKRYTIISGLAKGIDGQAHQSAMHASTIGVIGCGLDIVYPKEHASLYQIMKKRHLIISEYPLQTKPFASHFPWRNRILAALSEAVVVVEAKCKSGTMLTVNEALTLGIPIYCIPHDFMKEEGRGCNLLISQGANMVVDIEDLRLI